MTTPHDGPAPAGQASGSGVRSAQAGQPGRDPGKTTLGPALSPDPGAAAATVPVMPTQYSDAFRHWQEKRALHSDEALLHCLAQARECIEQMNHALSVRDEAYTRVHLEPTTHDDNAG